jgi:hypothetical protein
MYRFDQISARSQFVAQVPNLDLYFMESLCSHFQEVCMGAKPPAVRTMQTDFSSIGKAAGGFAY